MKYSSRSEGMFEKKMFSECLRQRRRCVIVVDGFYEWKTEETKSNSGKKSSKKQPYFIFNGADMKESEKLNNVGTESSVGQFSNTQNSELDPDGAEKLATTECQSADSSAPFSSSSPPPPPPPPPPPQASKFLAIAGVFNVNSPRSGEGRDSNNPLYSYSLITVSSSSTMNWLHERYGKLVGD